MTPTKILLTAAALLIGGVSAQAQMMFLAEEQLTDMAPQLPGSPVLYDIVGNPTLVQETVYESDNNGKRAVEHIKYTMSGGKVKEILRTDLTDPEHNKATLTAFTYSKDGKLQMMTVVDKQTNRKLQEITWRYDAKGKLQNAKSDTEVSGYLLDKVGGKYVEVTGYIYADYNVDPNGKITKVTSRHAAEYAPYSVSYRNGVAPDRTGTNFQYKLPGEAKYRMSSQYKLPESKDGITAAPDGTPIYYQREYSYTSEGWLMQMATNYDGYTDKEGNEVEPAEEEVNYLYETDEKGNWTRVVRITSTDPMIAKIFEREIEY